MFTRDDLIDLILSELKAMPQVKSSKIAGGREQSLPRGRIFLSEYEIKKMLTAQAQHLTIPREAIISPLATDWLILRGIKIIRE